MPQSGFVNAYVIELKIMPFLKYHGILNTKRIGYLEKINNDSLAC